MYISIIISTVIMAILVGLLAILHALAGAFPSAGHAIAIIQMILLISILILVHEAGHFFMAEVFKIKVTKFGFGLPVGPTLWKKKFKDVEILVHAFLFGGYVEFPDDDKDLNLPPDSPERFMNKPAYQRFFVVSAGVAANMVWAFIFVMLTAAMWGQMPAGKYEVYVKEITAPKSASVWQSGMQVGDKIVEVNGSTVYLPNTTNVYSELSKKNDGKVNPEFVERKYEELKSLNRIFEREEPIPQDVIIKLPPLEHEEAFHLDKDVIRGFSKFEDNRVEINDTQKAIRDKIDGKAIAVSDGTYTLNDVAYAISDNSAPLNIVVERNGERINLDPIYPDSKGLIGINKDIKEVTIQTKTIWSIIKTSAVYVWDKTKLILYSLFLIFTGKIAFSDMHGIIAVTKVGGDIIHTSGFFSGLLLTAIISINLAIMNFLPIPALDGGHVMALIIEKIRGKKIDEETMNKIATVFFVALIILMILVSYNDIYALITKKL